MPPSPPAATSPTVLSSSRGGRRRGFIAAITCAAAPTSGRRTPWCAARTLSDEVLATVRTAQAMEAALRTDRVANVAFYGNGADPCPRCRGCLQQLRILNSLGSQAMEEGEWDRALRWLDEALALPDNTNWPTLLAVSVVNRAEIFLALGRPRGVDCGPLLRPGDVRGTAHPWRRIPCSSSARSFAFVGIPRSPA